MNIAKIKNYSDYYEFGYSEFKKTESIMWNEYCKQKKQNYNLKELTNCNDYIVLNDSQRNVQYRLYKDLSKLELKIQSDKWFELYINGKNTVPKAIPVVSNDKDNTYAFNFNSDTTIICTGKSNVEFFDEAKSNHSAYAKKHKYNYFYYDDDSVYESNYVLRHTQKSKIILVTNIRCFFNSDEPLTTITNIYNDANVICSCTNDKFINKSALLFKVNSNINYKLFESNQVYKSELSNDSVIDNTYISDIKQDYHKAIIVSCGALHPSKVLEQYKINNKREMRS